MADRARTNVLRDARALATDVEDLLQETRLQLGRALETHPYLTLGAFAAAGYVLAGGLASRLTTVAVGTGARLATAGLLGRLVATSGAVPNPERATERNATHGSRTDASQRLQ